MAAYRCAFDQAELAAVEATPGVLQCPKCGYRTDTPGSGALADGFDVLHRQWGTRGDPHVWRAIRERIGATPTPDADDAVRHAYVDALREVTGVDVDASQEPSIYLETYNFGGMGGGHVSLEWWRTKGIPLLTERATARRPARSPSRSATAAPFPRNCCRSCSIRSAAAPVPPAATVAWAWACSSRSRSCWRMAAASPPNRAMPSRAFA